MVLLWGDIIIADGKIGAKIRPSTGPCDDAAATATNGAVALKMIRRRT